MPRLAVALLAGVVALGAAAAAEEFRMEFPVDCEPGRDCWLFQYFDHDPGPGWRDYACGKRSYDGHSGTDIALRDAAAMTGDVSVRAAAAGVVRAVRDGMPDRLYQPETAAGRECGNGVAIDHHPGGWATQYCHLRRGSVRVRPGERVEAGTPLGAVGLSGATEFPHLELVVRKEGRAVDPFAGPAAGAGCGLGDAHLWSRAALSRVAYSPVDILNVGFAAAEPQASAAHAGKLNRVRPEADAQALVVWTTLGGVRRGDRLRLRLVGPGGRSVVERERVLDRDQIRYFAYVGRKRRGAAWPAGVYEGEVVLERGPPGSVLRREATVRLEVR